MSTPLKPWELESTNFRENIKSNIPSISEMGISYEQNNLPRMPSAQPPPIPSRSSSNNNLYNSFTPYGPHVGSIGGPSVGSIGHFNSPYSYHNSNYHNSFGMSSLSTPSYNQISTGHNSFSQMAEFNTRNAFQSIETMVNAVTSISMMLDSTYQALFNSFRAVVGVADHFTRMKAQLVHVFSSLAILRTLRWVYRKLLHILRLKKFTESVEEIWQDASNMSANKRNLSKNNKSNWPVVVFLSLVVGSPWLIWKILNSFLIKGESWMKGECEHFIGRANFDFNTQQPDELSFKKDHLIIIAPKEMQPNTIRGWLLASVDGEKPGLVPANHIEILGKRNKLVEVETV